jgi:galactokinase
VVFERQIAVSSDVIFLVGVSGIVADKTGSALEKYNRVAELAREIVALWNRSASRNDEHLAAALRSSPAAYEGLVQVLQESPGEPSHIQRLLNRLEHFRQESESIIPAVPDRLVGDELGAFGELAGTSQALGARLLENQTSETVYLAASARRLGAVAASAFGAGFGGSVLALAGIADSEAFLEKWSSDYRKQYPHLAERSTFFATRLGPAAFRLESATTGA